MSEPRDVCPNCGHAWADHEPPHICDSCGVSEEERLKDDGYTPEWAAVLIRSPGCSRFWVCGYCNVTFYSDPDPA